MGNIKLNLYNFDKKRGYIPLDKDSEPLFKFKKDYVKKIDSALNQLGLYNITENHFEEGVRNKYPKSHSLEDFYGIGEKVKYKRFYTKNTNKVGCLGSKYIYIAIKDESKLSWNTVIRTLKIKKIHKPFFIYNYEIPHKKDIFHLHDNSSVYIKYKILALPISNIIDIKNINNYLNEIFQNNIQIALYIRYPFNYNINIKDVFTDKILQLYEVFDILDNHKELDLVKILNEYKIYKPIIYRDTSKYNNISKENWNHFKGNRNWENDNFQWAIDHSSIGEDYTHYNEREFINSLNFDYKDSWIITNKSEIKDKLYIIYPNLIRMNLVNKQSIRLAREDAKKIVKSMFIKYNDNKTYWDHSLDKIKSIDKALSKYDYIFDFCFNNQKDLSLKNQKFISNANRLSNVELANIQTYIVDKVFNDTNIYTKKESQKQYRFMLSKFIPEVFGKIKFDLEMHNKDYNKQKWFKWSNKLDKHIEGSFISNKEFNLFIDYLKDNFKEFNLTPSYNLKYKILKSIGLDINEDYDFELYGKTIVIKKDYVKHILYKLFSLFNNKENNFIYIYSKKFLDIICDLIKNIEINIKIHQINAPPDISLIEY